MKNVDIEELIDKAMAGRLSAQEQARWAALIAQRPDLAENLALGDALRSLPPPPRVSSNFTALVLQQLNQPQAPVYESPWVAWLRWRGFAKLTGAAAVLAVGFMALQHQRQVQMEKTVRTFAGLVSAVAPNQTQVPSEGAVSVLKDFEAIRQLPDATAVDYGLLAALRSN